MIIKDYKWRLDEFFESMKRNRVSIHCYAIKGYYVNYDFIMSQKNTWFPEKKKKIKKEKKKKDEI